MARKVFFSFYYKLDNWRASQVRNIGAIEGNAPVSDNDWEEIQGSDKKIQEWIDNQLKGRSCTIVLIGSSTAGRKRINYEIKKSWQDGKGVVGIYIHNLKDKEGKQTTKGKNPFDEFNISGTKFSEIVKAYDAPYSTSTNVYKYISDNIEDWVEEAIQIRENYPS